MSPEPQEAPVDVDAAMYAFLDFLAVCYFEESAAARDYQAARDRSR